ncbi:hypothetical protein [Pseudactinotalea terrae]|uniref:hypothetical protein n=1 Tax=Pseudactinotalea terrae TaxID=1743262 RepID=UPI0012E1E0FC|nr:hypothetical protein [Pseudactinotalea terrae]
MYPPGPLNLGEGEAGLSYAGVYAAAERDHVIAALGEMRFTGYVGPQEGTWVLSVAGNPLAKVAGKKRRIDDVARDLAATLEVVTLAAEVSKDERLRLWAFDGDSPLPVYDSQPPEDDGGAGGIVLDDFGNPVIGEGAFVDTEMVAVSLLAAFDADDPDGKLAELLEEDIGEDTNESERLTEILRILGLPTWIVSSDSLPRRVPGGPDREQVLRLGAGKPGVQGWFADALRRPVRPRPKRDL